MLSPYNEKAVEYLMAGWSPIPLPNGEKFPPPKGYTGANALVADEELVLGEWAENAGNIAVKLPSNLVGIDVDGMAGFNNLRALEAKLGVLPISYIVSNHETVQGGFTAFFNVPVGLRFKPSAAEKIDVIQEAHRYQVVPPSIHPKLRVYEWRQWGSDFTLPFVPEISAFNDLPASWINHLKKVVVNVSNEDLVSYDTNVAIGQCALLRSITNTHIAKLNAPVGGRHEKMVAATWAIVSEMFKGHCGGEQSLEAYKKQWLRKFAPGERDTETEFENSVSSAKAKQSNNRMFGCGCGRKKAGTYRKPKMASDFKMWK